MLCRFLAARAIIDRCDGTASSFLLGFARVISEALLTASDCCKGMSSHLPPLANRSDTFLTFNEYGTE